MKREVYCEDALEFFKRPLPENASVIASLPDISEFQGYSLAQWKEWFLSTASSILKATPENGVTIFYQSDIKHEGTWVDKGYLAQKAAEQLGIELLWHKIICRHPPGTITFGRPDYSHMLCFSKKVRAELGKSTADVLPVIGEKTWERGMGLEACLMAARFIKEQTSCTCVIHPFCGEGGMLAAANAVGLDAIGIERSPKRAAKARELQLSLSEKKWILPV